MIHDFADKAAIGEQALQRAVIRVPEMLDGCVSIEQATRSEDLAGVDLWATLRGGRRVGVDAKGREPGCSKFWSDGTPELALEVWSKMPDSTTKGVAGWTLNEKKTTEWVFYCWDSSDSSLELLLPFQALRVAFRRNVTEWREQYKAAPQPNSGWTSFAVFVPWPVVWREMCMVSFYAPEKTPSDDNHMQIVDETVRYMQEHYNEQTNTFDDWPKGGAR